MTERIHITTAITYSNGPPHVGHAYEYLATDTFARYMRRKLGRENVTFVTGTDEHGQKNRDAAAKVNLDPKAFADKISELFLAAHKGLNISYDYFVRTTDPVHQEFVRKMLARSYECGDIYFREYEGLYCVGCERFYTEKELLPGNICPEHNTPVELLKESNYFLKLEKYRAAILAHLEQHPDFIRPERYRNEALKMLAQPLEDLCISRPKARLDWGIELPFDDKFVTYVWYDAFWAYLSELPDTGDAALREILPVTEHFIGKDILKTHAVYWPAMLLSVGLPLYRHLNVHGFLNYGGARFSKSSGNTADPVAYETSLGPDVLRYFLLREVVYGLDGDFTQERLVERYNSDLANDLGNLTSRVLKMVQQYFDGEVLAVPGEPCPLFPLPPQSPSLDGLRPPVTALLLPLVQDTGQFLGRVEERRQAVDYLIDNLAFNQGLAVIWDLLDVANKYVTLTAPFSLVKDRAMMPRIAQILANLLEILRVVADTLEPFMPVTSRKILDLLKVDEATAHAPFGQGLKPGHRVKPATPLFPRIEKKKA